jgi:hypothetical protein
MTSTTLTTTTTGITVPVLSLSPLKTIGKNHPVP